MFLILPTITFLISFLLGFVTLQRTQIEIPNFSRFFYSLALGLILFTGFSYLLSLLFSFPLGVIITHLIITLALAVVIWKTKLNINPLPGLKAILHQPWQLALFFILIPILWVLFDTHVLPVINGDLYTGESTYGDLPFHLSTITQLVNTHKLPPDNPFFSGVPLVYPYLVNFFSAILVLEGMPLRNSIIIPGIILSFILVALVFDFALIVTKNKLASFLATILYFFHGGIGFYYFLIDQKFNLTNILTALTNPTQMKEYSHVFDQNIQWANLVSRMMVPERSLLFGLPAGIIALRLLFFRGNNSNISKYELILSALILSLIPLLHTHTVLSFIFIFPVLFILTLNKENSKTQLINFGSLILLTLLFALPYLNLFIGHVSGTEGFMRAHFGWMKAETESIFLFWFKNTYLFIPLSVLVLLLPKIVTKEVKYLQIAGLFLLIPINLILFSPYDWDNVKFLFWAGLFLAIGAASVFAYLLNKKNILLKIFACLVVFTMIASASLSILRELNVQYQLFSKEGVEIAENIKILTPKNSLFLTYKLHNSPVNNLAGREIMMGYPGMLWVHGIKYSAREQDINSIYAGGSKSLDLIKKYGINYVVTENSTPEGMIINRDYFSQFPLLLKSNSYQIYQVSP